MRAGASSIWGAFACAVIGGFTSIACAQGAPDTALANGAPVEKPSRAYNSMAIGGWLFSPTFFAGGIYDSNINQTSTGKVAGYGERIAPSFTASLNNGIYQTQVYGLLDGRFYQASGVLNDTQVSAKAGFNQSYEARRDLVLHFTGDYTRQQDVFSGWAFAQNPSVLASPLAAPAAISPQVSPTFYNQFTAAASVQKTFNRAFVLTGFSAQTTTFDNNPNFPVSRNGTIYTVPVRVGYYVTPQIYAFADPSADWRRYDNTALNSDGYRVTSGLGTKQGLWMGEVYAGYQAEKNDTLGTYGGDVFGARVIYSPTRMWTWQGLVDESLSSVAVAPGNSAATASRVATAMMNLIYNGLPMGWTANARLGFVRTAVVESSRVDNGWLIGGNIGYAIWRNFFLTLDYQYKSVASNFANDSFNDQTITLGLTYRY